MNYITGEKIQYICDVYIGESEFNPKGWIFNKTLYPEKCITPHKLSTNNKVLLAEKIYINPYEYDKYKNIILPFLKKIQHNFIIVFHNSDLVIDKSYLKLFECTKCCKIFGQNIIYKDERIQFLPIGLANSKWKHGNLKMFDNIVKDNITKTNNIFFNFSINTNKNKRSQCYNAFKNKLKFSKYSKQKDYWENLKKCKFAISPDGNGPDCHRIWECFYLDVIPICKKSVFTDIISCDFPIYTVNDWNELIINDSLFEKYDEYINRLDKKKLNLDYWKSMINNSL